MTRENCPSRVLPRLPAPRIMIISHPLVRSRASGCPPPLCAKPLVLCWHSVPSRPRLLVVRIVGMHAGHLLLGALLLPLLVALLHRIHGLEPRLDPTDTPTRRPPSPIPPGGKRAQRATSAHCRHTSTSAAEVLCVSPGRATRDTSRHTERSGRRTILRTPRIIINSCHASQMVPPRPRMPSAAPNDSKKSKKL